MTSRKLAAALTVRHAVARRLRRRRYGPSQAPTGPAEMPAATAEVAALAAEVRRLAAAAGDRRAQRPAPVRSELSLLGRALAFDKVLSGNRDISCMTCHLTSVATVDARSVAIGQGATRTRPEPGASTGRFVHRNAPPLFNLHAMKSSPGTGGSS